MVDGISGILKKAEREGLTTRYRVGEGSQSMTQLQFIDDTILFLEANERKIRNMQMCLKVYELISGFKINMSKAHMVRVNVEE